MDLIENEIDMQRTKAKIDTGELERAKLNPEFMKLVHSTADLIKTGKLDELYRRFKHELGEDNPEFIGSMRVIAGGMKSNGNIAGAHRIYKYIHSTMVKQGGETQPEVLKAYMDVISTASSAKDAFEMTRHAKDIATDDEIKEQLDTIHDTIRKSLTPTQQRLYAKLDDRKSSKQPSTAKSTETENANIDDIIDKFGLGEYITADDEKRESEKNAKRKKKKKKKF